MWNKVKLCWSKTNRWHRVLLIFLIVELRWIPGGQVGFWCNDPALSHPFNGDTITWKWLFATTILFPLPLHICVHCRTYASSTGTGTVYTGTIITRYFISQYVSHARFVLKMLLAERKYHRNEKSKGKTKSRALAWYKEYIFGLLINITVVQTIKLLVGSPRPHFFDTCQPEEALSCQGSEYVRSYTCTKAAWLHQSDKSFPSGHMSLALHAAVFIVYYMHRRTISSSVVRSLQALFALSALFCGLSRLADHRHHWWDVLCGGALALPILLYTIYLCKNFDCPEENCESTVPDPHQAPGTSEHKDKTHTITKDNNHTEVLT